MIHKRFARTLSKELYPSPHNDFVPHLLHERSVLGVLFFGGALFLLSQLSALTGNFGLTAEVLPAIIVDLTNKDRAAQSLSHLSVSPVLQEVAQMKADDMAAEGYFAHTSPSGITPWYWFTKAGYTFVYAGENLAVNFDDSQAVQTAWLNSPTHRANVLSANFTEIGVATSNGVYKGNPTVFVVEAFGMPAVAHAETSSVGSRDQTAVAQVPESESQPIPASSARPTETIAGEAAKIVPIVSSEPAVHPIKETGTFMEVENADVSLVQAPATPAPQQQLRWYQRVALRTDAIAGAVITIVLVVLFFATASMVAREYEKRHFKHMAYGSLMMIIFFSFLVIGHLGVFRERITAFAAPVADPLTSE